MDVAISRLTSPDDIDDVLRVEASSFTNPWTREMYLAELENPKIARVLIARDGEGRAVGFCSFWHVLDELHINNLAVRPECRREGVASALLTKVLAEAGEHRGTRATLEVRRSNDAAQRLYEHFGFRVTGVRRGYYNHPEEDALVLWRDET